MRRRSGSRAASTGTGATSNGCRSTPKERCSLRRPGGRSGPAPATCEESCRSAEEQRPLPRDAHDRHRHRPRIRHGDDPRAGTAAADGAAAQRADHRADRARRCTGRDAADGQARRHLHVARPRRVCHRKPAKPGAAPCSPNTAEEAGSTPWSRRAARRGSACGRPATARSSATLAYTRALRFCIYHLMIAANPDDPTVNIGANALAGERYRGHVFWDTEIFLLPVLHPHPARHRQGAAALPPPHPRRRTGELPRVRHRGRALRLGVRRHGSGGVPPVHRRRGEPVLDAGGGDPRLGRRRIRDRPVRRGDRRYGVPARHRRRDPLRDQPLLGRPRRAVGRSRRVRAPAGHGPRRVPLPCRQQRLHQPPRPVAPDPGSQPVRRAA